MTLSRAPELPSRISTAAPGGVLAPICFMRSSLTPTSVILPAAAPAAAPIAMPNSGARKSRPMMPPHNAPPAAPAPAVLIAWWSLILPSGRCSTTTASSSVNSCSLVAWTSSPRTRSAVCASGYATAISVLIPAVSFGRLIASLTAVVDEDNEARASVGGEVCPILGAPDVCEHRCVAAAVGRGPCHDDHIGSRPAGGPQRRHRSGRPRVAVVSGPPSARRRGDRADGRRHVVAGAVERASPAPVGGGALLGLSDRRLDADRPVLVAPPPGEPVRAAAGALRRRRVGGVLAGG